MQALFTDCGPLSGVYTEIVANCSAVRTLPIFFYSADENEPPHVHVERDDGKAKFWLEPVRLDTSSGFGRPDIRRVERLVEEHAVSLLRSWNEYFGT